MSSQSAVEYEELQKCKEVLAKAHEVQRLMGDRTAKFVPKPSGAEIYKGARPEIHTEKGGWDCHSTDIELKTDGR